MPIESALNSASGNLFFFENVGVREKQLEIRVQICLAPVVDK